MGMVQVFTTMVSAPTHAEAHAQGLRRIQDAVGTKDDPVHVTVRRSDVVVDIRLLPIADIARVLGLSRQRVQQLSKRGLGFPDPWVTTSQGPLYRQRDIEHYREKREARIAG